MEWECCEASVLARSTVATEINVGQASSSQRERAADVFAGTVEFSSSSGPRAAGNVFRDSAPRRKRIRLRGHIFHMEGDTPCLIDSRRTAAVDYKTTAMDALHILSGPFRLSVLLSLEPTTLPSPHTLFSRTIHHAFLRPRSSLGCSHHRCRGSFSRSR
jgi:hypothetical protein